MRIEIERTKSGKPALWCGGGAFTQTFKARFVLNAMKKLKEQIFLKKHGKLASSFNQVLVPLSLGDIIVEVNCRTRHLTPAAYAAKALQIYASQIVKFANGEAITEKIHLKFSVIPSKVWGANNYHNRDGSYFVGNSFDTNELV